MKKVFVVNGSEHGNIGVFFSERKAVQHAMQYLFQDGKTMTLDIEINKMSTLIRVTSKVSNVKADVELWLV